MAPPQRKGQPIPFGRHSSHFAKIQNNLALVLCEIKAIPALNEGILWVSCRLNRSGTKDSPVFVGWVEDIQAIRIRVQNGYTYPPIDLRFGDTHPSRLYTECLKKPAGEPVLKNWSKQSASPGSQELGKNFYNETHRMSVPVKINGRSVGTLNAAFRGDPSDDKDEHIRGILFRWAQDSKSDLVKYIKENLDYSEYSPSKS